MAAPSKLRELRDKINTETDALANVVRDLFHIEKKSHLKYLKAARCYLSKSKKLANIPQAFTPQIDRFIDSTLVDELFNGFIVCFDNKRRLVYKRQATDIFGELICISDNFQTHLGLNAVDALLTYDTIGELTSNNDREYFDELFANPQLYAYPKSLTSYTSWFVSRIKRQNLNTCDYKRFKMTSHYVPSMDAFVGLCTPVLSSANRGELLEKDRSNCFRTVHKSDLKLINAQGDLADFFAFEPQTSLYQMITPDCLETVTKRHKEVLKNGRGSVDLIKLAAKNDGANVINCLMNMTMEKREQIVCVYQILSNEEAKIYQVKSSKFESEIMSSCVGTLNTSLSAPTSVEPDFDDDSDDFEDDEADGRSVLVTEAKRGSKRPISATYTHTPKDEPLEEPAQKQTHFTYELNINTQYIPPVIDQTHYSPIVFEAPTSTFEHCKEIDDIVNNLKDVCEQFGKVRDEEESLNLDLNLNFLELSPVAVVEPELQWDEFTWNFDVEEQQQQNIQQLNEQSYYLNEVY